MKVEIVWEGGSGVDRGVKRFWRDGADLVLEYEDEDREDLPYRHGEAIAACPEDADIDDPTARVAGVGRQRR